MSEITTAPSMAPLMEGANVALMVQLAPAAKAPPQGVPPLPAAAKFPLAAIELMVTELALWFLTVTVFPALVVPVACLANDNETGVNLSGAVVPPVPFPVNFTPTGLYAPV